MKLYTVVLCIGLAQGMSLVATAEESQVQQSLTEPGVFEVAEETLSDLNIISDQIPVQKMLNDTGEFERGLLCNCKDRFKKEFGTEVMKGSILSTNGLTETIASACYKERTGWFSCTCSVCYDGKKSICSSHCNRLNGVSVFRSAKENSVKRLLDADKVLITMKDDVEYVAAKKKEKAEVELAWAAEAAEVKLVREAEKKANAEKKLALAAAKIENEEYENMRNFGDALGPIDNEDLLFDEADAEKAAAKEKAEAEKAKAHGLRMEGANKASVKKWIAFADAADPAEASPSEYVKLSDALLDKLKELLYYGIITETRFTELQGQNDLHENTKIAEAAQAAEQAAEAVEAAKDPGRIGRLQSIAGKKTQDLIDEIRLLGKKKPDQVPRSPRSSLIRKRSVK